MQRIGRVWTGAAMLLASLVVTGTASPPTALAADEFAPLEAPQRIVDTRSTGETVDGLGEATGAVTGGQRLEVQVAGRAGVAADASAVVLNVTVVAPAGPGFITVFPCDQPQPNGSNINYSAQQVIANAVFARLDANGRTCVFTSATSQLIVDVTGTLPGQSFAALDAPARLLDTRPTGQVLDDDQRFENTGRVSGGSTFRLDVAGRSGVAADATTAVLNVAAVQPGGPGFVTVHPCDQDLPLASNLNFAAQRNIANTVVTRLDGDGRVCLFTSATTDLIVDVTGTLASTAFVALDAPARLHDSRSNGATIDGVAEQTLARRPGTTLELPVAGRAGLPADASAVVLNVVSVQSRRNGFVTVHPRNSDRPNASNLNHAAGEIIANSVVAKVGGNGEICFFNSSYTELVIDVSGYFVGPAPADTGDGCPMEFPPFSEPGLDRAANAHVVGEFQMPPGRYETAGVRPEGFGTCDVFKWEFFGDFFSTDTGQRGRFVSFQNARVVFDVVAGTNFVETSGSCGPIAPYVAGTTGPVDLSDAGGVHVVGDHIQPG
ncbi:MAG: hypothetical protein AAGG08_06715, partial [Actinomycetota bacterium]